MAKERKTQRNSANSARIYHAEGAESRRDDDGQREKNSAKLSQLGENISRRGSGVTQRRSWTAREKLSETQLTRRDYLTQREQSYAEGLKARRRKLGET